MATAATAAAEGWCVMARFKRFYPRDGEVSWGVFFDAELVQFRITERRRIKDRADGRMNQVEVIEWSELTWEEAKSILQGCIDNAEEWFLMPEGWGNPMDLEVLTTADGERGRDRLQ